MSVEKLIVKTRETTANDPTKPGSMTVNELEALRAEVARLRGALVDIVGVLVPGIYTRQEALAKMNEVDRIVMAALDTITDEESRAAIARLFEVKDHE